MLRVLVLFSAICPVPNWQVEPGAIEASGETVVFDVSRDGSAFAYASDLDHVVWKKSSPLGWQKVGRGDEPTLLRDGSIVVSGRDPSGRYRLHRIDKNGEVKRLVAAGAFDDTCPCATQDGQIVFARSYRTRRTSMGGFAQTDIQIMKTSVDGIPYPVTRERFFRLVLRPGCDDGKHIYFSGELTAASPAAVFRVEPEKRSRSETLLRLSVIESVCASKNEDLIAFTDRADANYFVKTARKNGGRVRIVSRTPAEQLRFLDSDGSLALLRRSESRKRFFVEEIDLRTMKVKRKIGLNSNRLTQRPQPAGNGYTAQEPGQPVRTMVWDGSDYLGEI